jgi:hypothetical protein
MRAEFCNCPQEIHRRNLRVGNPQTISASKFESRAAEVPIMVREFRQNFLGVLTALAILSFAIYGLATLRLPRAAAHSSSEVPAPPGELHEADHHLQAAVYTTVAGWSSSLLLLNAEGKPITAHVTLYNRQGAALAVPEITLGPYKSRSWNVADWISDVKDFEEGSLTVSYNGLSMGLHAQETVTNRSHSMSFDVHLEDEMESMTQTMDGLWWGLEGQTDARVFIANTRATQTSVTPTFYVAGVAHQGEPIMLEAHASHIFDLGKELKEIHLSSTSGGISFSYTNGPGAISVVGAISNKHSGFSTTMRFADHMGGTSTSLHGANLMIGKPATNPGFSSTTRFTPHLILRNTTTQVVQVNVRIRFTLFDQPNVTELPPATLAANEVRELDVSPAINSIGDSAVQDAGIEIEYAGLPGALMAYATSVDQTGSNAFDVPIKDPKGMMFKGGANPWRIDGTNRAVLHIKNVNAPDGEKHQFTVSLYYEGGVYNLPVQTVEAGQTAEIDIRKLRDEQIDDGLGHVIPLNVSSGQLSWYPRAKKGDFIGRLVQYNPSAGTSSSFSCDEPCWCGPDYFSSFTVPGSFNGVPGDVFQVNAYEVDMDCHGWPHGPYHITYANFYTDNPFVADVFYQSSSAYVVLVGGGSCNITALWDGYYTAGEDCQEWDWASGWCLVPNCDYASVPATPQTQVTSASVDIKMNGSTVTGQTVNVIVGQEINLTTSVQPANGTVTNSQWTVPGGDSDRIANYVVTFTEAQTSGVVTNLTTLNNSSVRFYWISGGNGRTVQYSAQVNGKAVHAQVTFNVQRPSAQVSTVTGRLFIDRCTNPFGFLELHFGMPPSFPQNYGGCLGNPGITFTRTEPSGGDLQWVQLGTINDAITLNDGTRKVKQTTGLDTIYPYPPSSLGPNVADDEPGAGLSNNLAGLVIDENFTMFLMFKPSGVSGNSIWVPLRKVNWFWSATLHRTGNDTWEIDTNANSPSPLDENATVHPQWTSNIVDASYH